MWFECNPVLPPHNSQFLSLSLYVVPSSQTLLEHGSILLQKTTVIYFHFNYTIKILLPCFPTDILWSLLFLVCEWNCDFPAKKCFFCRIVLSMLFTTQCHTCTEGTEGAENEKWAKNVIPSKYIFKKCTWPGKIHLIIPRVTSFLWKEI